MREWGGERQSLGEWARGGVKFCSGKQGLSAWGGEFWGGGDDRRALLDAKKKTLSHAHSIPTGKTHTRRKYGGAGKKDDHGGMNLRRAGRCKKSWRGFYRWGERPRKSNESRGRLKIKVLSSRDLEFWTACGIKKRNSETTTEQLEGALDGTSPM